MRQVNIFICSLTIENKNEPMLGIAITDTLENAKIELHRYYSNIEEIEHRSTMSWSEFKSMFDTSTWPFEYQFNDDGWFDEDTFFEVCQFILSLLNVVMNHIFKTQPFNINLN